MARRWRPELHPRNPRDGKFIERGGSGWAQSLAGQLAAVRTARERGTLQDPTFLRGLTRAPEGGFRAAPGNQASVARVGTNNIRLGDEVETVQDRRVPIRSWQVGQKGRVMSIDGNDVYVADDINYRNPRAVRRENLRVTRTSDDPRLEREDLVAEQAAETRRRNSMTTAQLATEAAAQTLTRGVSTGKMGGMTTPPAAPRPGKKITAKDLPAGYEVRNSGQTDYSGKTQYEVYGPDGDIIGDLVKTTQETHIRSSVGNTSLGVSRRNGYKLQPRGASSRSVPLFRTVGQAIDDYNRTTRPTIVRLRGLSPAELDAELRRAVDMRNPYLSSLVRAERNRRNSN